MSILSRSFAARAAAVLALAGGLALATPAPAESAGAGIVLTDGDRRGHRGDRHWRGDRGHHDRHWREHRRPGRHWRHHRPPPWAHHFQAPPWRPHVRHCRVVWSVWHGGYVKVCG